MKKFCLKILLFLIFILSVFLYLPGEVLAAASLSFSPASQSVSINNEFNVDVILNTGGSDTDGADVIVKYDGNKLEVSSASLGDLYANKLVIDTSTSGEITLRATSTADDSYNGTGTFATITFKAIAEGTANVYFDFTSGSTTDSNVAYLGDDLLGSVSNASYTISQAAAVGGNGETASPSPSASPSVPVSGTASPTIILLLGGVLLIIIGGIKLLLPLLA